MFRSACPRGTRIFTKFPDMWVRAVQAFACLGIAYYRGDEPWADSQRRRILTDLLFGPEDWVTEAAGFALVATAWAYPETRDDVGAMMVERMSEAVRASRTRVVTIAESLCELTLACPGVPADSRALAWKVLRKSSNTGVTPPPASARSQPAGGRRKLFGRR